MLTSSLVLTCNLNNGTRVLAEARGVELEPVRYISPAPAEQWAAALQAAGINARVYAPASSRLRYVEVLPDTADEALTGPDDMRYYVPADGCDCGELLCSGVHRNERRRA